MGWVDVVVDSYRDSECPAKFFYWSALASISAVMRKSVFLDRFTYILYPNIYVFIVARSGMKKGIAVTLSKTLVSKAGNTRVISGRNSMPRIVQDLGKAYTTEQGGVIRDAQCYLVSGELGAFLVKDPDALTVLTDLHDTHAHEDHWVNSLKGTGVDKLKAPCITLLGATNEEHFADAVPQNAIGGGFIARTFIVFSLDKGKLNSLMYRPSTVPDTAYLAEYLKELAKFSGQMQMTDMAKKAYDAWYYPFCGQDISDPTGTNNRIGDQILKVAMLLSLSESPSLEVKESHTVESIRVCTDCINGMKQVTMGAGKSNLASQTKIVMRELLMAPGNQIEHSKLLSRFWGDFDAFDLARIAETLASAEAIEIIPHGRDFTYKMKKSALDMYQRTVRTIQ